MPLHTTSNLNRSQPGPVTTAIRAMRAADPDRRELDELRTTPPHSRVYEHGDFDSAVAEARRLAAKFKREFAVFQEIGSARPDPDIGAEPAIAAPPPNAGKAEQPAPRVPVVERRAPRRRKPGGAA